MRRGPLSNGREARNKDVRGSHFPALKDEFREFQADFGVIDRWRDHS